MKKKTAKALGEAARMSVQKDMAKPRMSKSVWEAETNAMRTMPTHGRLHSRSS
jgi:hypothetical protein